MFSLRQDRQRWLTCGAQCLHAAWNVSNQFSIVGSLLYVLSVIFYCRLSETQTIQLLVCVASLSCLSSPLIFSFFLSTHFSTLRVYRIVIIESYASLPLHAPYVALSVFLSIFLPLLPERV